MSLVCIAAARARIIPFWLAVTVAVLGGLGPFAGSIGFVDREPRRRRRRRTLRVADHALQLTADGSRYRHGSGRDACDGRLGRRGHRPRVAQAGRRPRRRRRDVRRDLDRQGRRRGSLSGRRHGRQDPRRRGRHRRGRRAAGRDRHRRRRRAPSTAPPSAAAAPAEPASADPGSREAPPAAAGERRRAGRRRPTAGRPSRAAGQTIDIVTPTGGESVTEGTILEWSVKVGDAVKDGDTVVEISTDKVDMELPAPASGTITEILAEEGETVTVGQVIARMTAGAVERPAGERRRAPPRRACEEAAQAAATRRPTAPTPRPSPAASPPTRASTSPPSRAARAAGRITKADVLAAAAATAARPPPPARRAAPAAPAAGARSHCSRAAAPRWPATWTRAARSRPRPRSGRSPSTDARAAPQAAQGRRAAGLVHAPDRVRDRAWWPPTRCR